MDCGRDERGLEVRIDESDLDVRYEGEPIEALAAAWTDGDLGLGQLARAVSRYYTQSRLTMEGAARYLDASPAEFEALLGLATLDDDDLIRLSAVNPPKTTWLFFADAEAVEIEAGLKALGLDSPTDAMAAQRVYDAMRKVGSPTLDDRVAAISGATLGHLATKAKQYGTLSPKAVKFLGSVASRKRLGNPLTEKQLEWLKSVLHDLVEQNVIRRESPDGDQDACDEVLAALGA